MRSGKLVSDTLFSEIGVRHEFLEKGSLTPIFRGGLRIVNPPFSSRPLDFREHFASWRVDWLAKEVRYEDVDEQTIVEVFAGDSAGRRGGLGGPCGGRTCRAGGGSCGRRRDRARCGRRAAHESRAGREHPVVRTPA